MAEGRRTRATRPFSSKIRPSHLRPHMRRPHAAHLSPPPLPPPQRHHRQQPTTSHRAQTLPALAPEGQDPSSNQNLKTPPLQQSRPAPSFHSQGHMSSPPTLRHLWKTTARQHRSARLTWRVPSSHYPGLATRVLRADPTPALRMPAMREMPFPRRPNAFVIAWTSMLPTRLCKSHPHCPSTMAPSPPPRPGFSPLPSRQRAPWTRPLHLRHRRPTAKMACRGSLP